MLDILFARTFLIVGMMLCLTAVTAKVNRYFETAFEMWATFIISLLLLFLIFGFAGSYPLNIIIVAAFSLVIGWEIGPAIEHFGTRYKLRMHLKDRGVVLKKGEKATEQQIQEFSAAFDRDTYHKEWQNIIFQAVMGTALAIVSTASVVFFTDIDFGFLGGFLLISLIIETPLYEVMEEHLISISEVKVLLLINQCLKWRMPVNTIAMPCSFAAAITSSSRIDPPG